MRGQPALANLSSTQHRIDDLRGNAKHIRNSALPYLSSHGVNSALTFVPAATFGQLTDGPSRHDCKYTRWKPRGNLVKVFQPWQTPSGVMYLMHHAIFASSFSIFAAFSQHNADSDKCRHWNGKFSKAFLCIRSNRSNTPTTLNIS